MPLIIRASRVKKVRKATKTTYMPLKPGDSWQATASDGSRLLIIADEHNTGDVYVGELKRKL